MDKVLFENGDLKVELVAGDVVASLNTQGLKVVATVSSEYAIDKLKELVPGQIDDVVFDIIKGALKA
jgi:hypothetical protein